MSDDTAAKRFRVHYHGSGRHFFYQFYDDGVVVEAGEASSPRVIAALFDEFKRGQASKSVS